MKENNEKIGELLGEFRAKYPPTQREKFISWEWEMHFLFTQQDDLRKIEPDVGTEQHIEWLINMNYVYELIKENTKHLEDI
jgi:hypothetical protein